MHHINDWKEDYTKVYNHSIGQGTFGKVFLVKSNQNDKYYAMKEICLKQYILKTSLINRSYALDEGFKLIKLNLEHENIIKYHKSYLYDDSIYWIMDYCDGGTLRDKISLYIKQNKYIDENLIWYWSLQIINGLKYLHSKGVIHRDLKPDNIYIHGKKGLCKIGDFGFAKLVVESSITENRTIDFINEDLDNFKPSLKHQEERIVYKLINMSQVGTPAYIAPELRFLIDSHLNYSSIETINESVKLCEKNIFKGDLFSFGCILYELVLLRNAFENKFKLPDDVYLKANLQIETNARYSSDLKALIKLCLAKDPEERPNINELFNQKFILDRLDQDYIDSYKKQIIPNLAINTRQNALVCITANLDEYYKPIQMKSLKFNQNLIIILAIKNLNINANNNYRIKPNLKIFNSTMSTFSNLAINKNEYYNLTDQRLEIEEDFSNLEESKFLIYNEYGQLLKEFDSFLIDNKREKFNFKIYDFCVDEEYDHLYISTRKFGLLRFNLMEQKHYFDDLILDGKLDLSELLNENSNFFPTCLNLIEDEEIFKESLKTTGKRLLIFYDRVTKRIVSLQVDLKKSQDSIENNQYLIKTNLIAGLTLEQQYIRQMVSTSKELICLFDDLSLIKVFNLKTLQLVRTNRFDKSKSFKRNIMCLTLDSDDYLYSTNGKSIFNLDYIDFKQKKRISPSIKKGENLSHTICWMTILTNSKLVLLTDALQMEKSILYILKPVNYKKLESKEK